MPKFYVRSGRVRLVVVANSAEQAAVKAFQWPCERQAEIYRRLSGDLIRDAEAVDYALEDEIHVNETGFAGEGAFFDLLEIADRCRIASSG